MTWTVPITVATNDLLSAAQYNQSVRDNLLEMAPAKATASGNIFVTTGPNALVERDVTSASVATLETTSSSQYGDLDTVGPQVSVDCHAAMVFFSARMRNANAASDKGSYVSIAVSGGASIPASDAMCISVTGIASNNPIRVSGVYPFTGTIDSRYTFTMKYRCQTGYPSSQFDFRDISVIPL